jgi:hypothetical protein
LAHDLLNRSTMQSVTGDKPGSTRMIVQVTLTGPLYDTLKLRAECDCRSLDREIVSLLYLGLTVEDFPDYLVRHAHAAWREALDADPAAGEVVPGRLGRQGKATAQSRVEADGATSETAAGAGHADAHGGHESTVGAPETPTSTACASER